jgi:hypothetical protein
MPTEVPEAKYRVVRHKLPGATLLLIHEALYNADGSIHTIHADCANPEGWNKSELRGQLQAMLSALDEPVLNFTDYHTVRGD